MFFRLPVVLDRLVGLACGLLGVSLGQLFFCPLRVQDVLAGGVVQLRLRQGTVSVNQVVDGGLRRRQSLVAASLFSRMSVSPRTVWPSRLNLRWPCLESC